MTPRGADPRWRRGPLGVFSRKLLQLENLGSFLAEWGEPVPARNDDGSIRDDLVAIVGWGHRDTAGEARAAAADRKLPYLALEDGFLRSVGLGGSGVAPLSLIIDDRGIYYDAAQPSRLEALIAERRRPPPEALQLLALIRDTGLTKFNLADHVVESAPDRVYVLDQTVGDISVFAGAGDQATFEAMLDSAVREHGAQNVVMRAHPVVVAGQRQGHLMAYAAQRGVAIDTQSNNWIRLAASARRVYTVSSQGGFEALIAGAPVTCFGIPFYAGWGLTDDRQHCRRRNARPSLEQLFTAAYWDYARYVDPATAQACNGLAAAELLIAARLTGPRTGLLSRLSAAFGR